MGTGTLKVKKAHSEPQANDSEWRLVHERIILLNRFFLVNYSELDKPFHLIWDGFVMSRTQEVTRCSSYEPFL